MLSLHALGGLRLVDGDGNELLTGRRKVLVLLTYIARRRPRGASRSELAALLWGEHAEANARASLRQALFQLRPVLGESLRVEGEILTLAESALELDLARFESAIANGRFADAIALWDGDFLDGAEDAGTESCRLWIEQERQRARQRLTWAFDRLVQECIGGGAYAEAASWSERWCQSAPLDEHAHSQLVRSLRLAGRVGEARAQIAAFRARYRDAFDAEPSAELLRLATEPPEPVVREPFDAVPFLVGRSRAFAQLTSAWEQASRGVASVILIEGEYGLGKTRLCVEFLRWLEAERKERFVLRATAASSRTPWSTLRELGTVLPDAPGLLGASAGALAELTRIAPEIHLPTLGAPNGDDRALRDAFVEAVTAIAAEVPVVLLIDDFALADDATIQAVLALGARLDDARVLVLLAASDDDLRRNPAVHNALAAARRFRRVTLAPLAAADVDALMAERFNLPQAERAALAERLQREAQGNPRYTLDMVDALVREQYLRRDERGEWHVSPLIGQRPLPVPSSLREATARRLAQLTPEARSVAATLVKERGALDVSTIARIERRSGTQVYGALDELIGQRLVREDVGQAEGESARYTFANHTTRAAVAAWMAAARGDAPRRARRALLALAAVAIVAVVSAPLMMARRTRTPPPSADTPTQLAGATSASATAYRLYEMGVRAYTRDGDVVAGRQFFAAAVREDSTLAMAHYYLALAAGGGPSSWPEYEAADRYANRVTERERLLIRTAWASERQDPAGLALAETLAVRYPDDPDGLIYLGIVEGGHGRMGDALRYLHRALDLDSASLRAAPGARGRCIACDALRLISVTYQAMDSATQSIDAMQQVLRMLPSSTGDWWELGMRLLAFDRFPEALEAYRHAQTLGAGTEAIPTFYVEAAIRSGDFAMADRLLEGPLRAGSPGVQYTALWLHAISLRHQGRLREALEEAHKQHRFESDSAPQNAFDGAIMEALTLFDMGRARESAVRFDSIATRSAPVGEVLRHRAARHRAWMLTHVATALAAAGDTGALPRLADSIQVLGAQSSYGRDERLHHYVRGLLLSARGQLPQAEAEFRRATYSWSMGYTRTNLELGRLMLAERRPLDAIAVVHPALHGPLDASNLYVTRTELQELLAKAFDAAGDLDSARVYYVRVANAWRGADPEFHARWQYAARRAAQLGGALPIPRR